jgi:hypothetical protein
MLMKWRRSVKHVAVIRVTPYGHMTAQGQRYRGYALASYSKHNVLGT